MNKTSIMYLRNLTQIDMGIILPNGKLEGRSFNLSCEVVGEIEQEEQVVVDFSTIKKAIKNVVDDKEVGIDHKTVLFHNPEWYDIKETDTGVKVTTSSVILETPKIATCQISLDLDMDETETDVLVRYLEELLLRELRPIYPNLVKIRCQLNTNVLFDEDNYLVSTFIYTHGLKKSSSWGCQNIAHGHLSWLEAKITGDVTEERTIALMNLLDEIAIEIDDSVFIFNENIQQDAEDFLKIGYTTERGVFSATYNKSSYNLIIMETETTIENIVAAIYRHYGLEQYKDILTLYVSEGLSKGALI